MNKEKNIYEFTNLGASFFNRLNENYELAFLVTCISKIKLQITIRCK